MLAAEAAHDAVTVDRFGRDVGHVTHCDLDLPALLAELAARVPDHQADQRQDRDHHQRKPPVHPQQVREEEHDGEPLADHDLDRVGRRAGDHRHVERDARDQMPGAVLVEIGVRQSQQAVEQCLAQILHESQRNSRKEIIAEIAPQPLPRRDEHDHQRHAVHQFHAVEQRHAGDQRRVGMGQTIDEILQHAGEHRLRGSEDDVAEDADCEQSDIGPDVAQQAEVDPDAGCRSRIGMLHGAGAAMGRRMLPRATGRPGPYVPKAASLRPSSRPPPEAISMKNSGIQNANHSTDGLLNSMRPLVERHMTP